MKHALLRSFPVTSFMMLALLVSRPTEPACTNTTWTQCFSQTWTANGTTLVLSPTYNESAYDPEHLGSCPAIPSGGKTFWACLSACTMSGGGAVGVQGQCQSFFIAQGGSQPANPVNFPLSNTPQGLMHIEYDGFQ